MDYWNQLIVLVSGVWAAIYGIYKFVLSVKKKRKIKQEQERQALISDIQDTIILKIKDKLIEVLLEDTKNILNQVKVEAEQCMDKVKELLEKDMDKQNKDLEEEINTVKDSLNSAVEILEEYAVNKVSTNMTLSNVNEKLIIVIREIEFMRQQIIDIEKNIIIIKIKSGVSTNGN